MKTDRELYKETFSQLHASADREPGGIRHHRQLQRPIAACLAALGILIAAATVSYAMTGESPIYFFKSFFQHVDDSASEELNNTYIVVTNQSVNYKNLNLSLEGYSYTGDTLLAKFNVSSRDGTELRIEDIFRIFEFIGGNSGTGSTEFEDVQDGVIPIIVRLNLGDIEDYPGEIQPVNIIVSAYEEGITTQVGTFCCDEWSPVTELVVAGPAEETCESIRITGMRLRIFFDQSVTDIENLPVDTIGLMMKNGDVWQLYDTITGTNTDSPAASWAASYSPEAGSDMTILFSDFIDVREIEAIIINGRSYTP